VETTGLSPQRDRILELAIVRLDESGTVVDEWVSRFDPEAPVGATHIHGITQADVVGQPRFADAAPTVVAALSGLAVVAHNAKFDVAFLRNELDAAGWDLPWIASYCTLDASYAYLPDMDRRRLVDCCWAVGVRLDDAHSALGDARAAAGLLAAYVTVNGGPDPALVEALASARSTTWSSHPARESLTADQRAARGSSRARPLRITPPRPSSSPLLQQLTALSLLEVVEEGAPVGTTAYVEMLFDALEDGDISEAEADALRDLVTEYELSTSDVHAAHEAFLLALAHRAVDDGRVSREERQELNTVASLLGVANTKVKQVIDRADAARHARLGAGLGPLPTPWPHGEPLRVGDRVAFTGCDETQRARLEGRAEELGVRVISSVSRLTVMLITDGSFSGGKLAKAQQLGTRHVHPDVFDVLLRHLQPARNDATEPVTPIGSVQPVAAGPAAALDGSPSSIRAWATATGYEVGVRGRLPKHVIDAYTVAHS
jgi:DNA polymerase-3 subunit epsilon